MTDTWRTLPEGAAAGLSGNVRGEQASDAPSDGGGLRNDYRAEIERLRADVAELLDQDERNLAELVAVYERAERAEAAVARVEAVIAPMHEDWCRAKHDPGRECECIHAEIRAAIDGDS